MITLVIGITTASRTLQATDNVKKDFEGSEPGVGWSNSPFLQDEPPKNKLRKVIFKPETSILRLSNYKSKKYLKWHPKWSINKSLDKIIIWNKEIKKKPPLNICFKQIQEYLND